MDLQGDGYMTSGMNIAEVRELTVKLHSAVEGLRGAVAAVDRPILHSSWRGRDADSFRQNWWPRCRHQLLIAAEGLEGLARAAAINVVEQERASGMPTSGEGASSQVPTGLPPTVLATTTVIGMISLIKSPAVALVVDRALERRRDLGARGGVTVGGVPASYEATAAAYARSHAAIGVRADRSGLTADAQAGAVLGARADLKGGLGNEHVGVNGNVYAEAQAGARGAADAAIGLSGASGALHGDVGASVSVGTSAHAHISGIEAGGRIHAYAGVSAHADVQGSVTLKEIKTHVELGASLGLGYGVGFDVHVKPAQLLADAGPLANKWSKGLRL
jgi:hypothetical protein